MHVEIINPDKTIFTGEAELVQLPGKSGSFEIMNNHAPIISVLQEGKVKIVDFEKKETFYEIRGGVIEVMNNKVLILSE